MLPTTPKTCPSCGKDALVTLGAGTEKIEETLKKLFPGRSIARLDRDTAIGNGLTETLSRMKSRDIDILVGTQMVTKGHDFPHVTLVCVLDADAGLKLPDFRAGERTVQLLTQVAGRAGRGENPVESSFKATTPNTMHSNLCKIHDHEGFIEREAKTCPFGYPPYQAAVVIRTEGKDRAAVAVSLDGLPNSSKNIAKMIQHYCAVRHRQLLNGFEGNRGGPSWSLIQTVDDYMRSSGMRVNGSRSLPLYE